MENIFSFVLVVLTAGLLIITLIYVRHTKTQAEEVRKMADVLERDYIARNTPVVDFEVTWGSSFDQIDVKLQISNYGQVAATLNSVEFSGPYRDDPNNGCRLTYPAERLLPPSETTVHAFRIHRHELLPSDDPKYQKRTAPQLAQNVDGKFRISYSDSRGGTMYKEKKHPHW